MSFAIQSLLQPQVLSRILADPEQIFFYVEPAFLFFLLKIAVLAILLGYVLFAFASFIHIRRLETWLPMLRMSGHYSRWALIHFFLALGGWLAALIWL